MFSDLPPKIYTSIPQLRCCVAPMFRELKASAAVATWPIMKLKSSSSSPILSRCSTPSPTSSHCLAKRAANRCRASKVTMFCYRIGSSCCSPDALWDVSTLLFTFTDLPDTPVDLIINCLDCHENTFLMDQPWYRAAADWANQNRAPVLSLDPPASGQRQAVEAKWSLSLCLPLALAEGAGRVYLCDIGIPRQVFQEVGIKYHSPFGCKFVIPLHSA